MPVTDMKVIYVGSLSLKPDRDSGWVRELRGLHCEVTEFSTHIEYSRSLADRVCRRLSIGAKHAEMLVNLLKTVQDIKPDWVHFRLPIEFSSQDIQKIRDTGAVVTSYFNDDPFSKKSPLLLHRKFLSAIPRYDAHFVYRQHNVDLFERAGASFVQHCPPAYDPARHYPVSKTADSLSTFEFDAAFIGHCEGDWRVECLSALVRAGLKVCVKGGGWDNAVFGTELQSLVPVVHAFGEEYNFIYGQSVAGLCFFSKINRDSWTERALEIVAVGGVLVCERTKEAESYFVDREEAFFFSTVQELVDIVQTLKTNPQMREMVKVQGHRKLLKLRASIGDRAQQVLSYVKSALG